MIIFQQQTAIFMRRYQRMLNNTVFITGASRGIGLSIAQAFASEGHFVIGTSRSKFNLESA